MHINVCQYYYVMDYLHFFNYSKLLIVDGERGRDCVNRPDNVIIRVALSYLDS